MLLVDLKIPRSQPERLLHRLQVDIFGGNNMRHLFEAMTLSRVANSKDRCWAQRSLGLRKGA